MSNKLLKTVLLEYLKTKSWKIFEWKRFIVTNMEKSVKLFKVVRIHKRQDRRNRMSNFKESLYHKKSFIYQIGDTYYAIGADTFSAVTDTEETDNLELLQNALKKKNERQISKYLDKVIRIATMYRVDAKEHYRVQDKLFAFIDQLAKEDEKAYLKLQRQVDAYDTLFAEYSKYNKNDAPIEQ